MEKDSDTAPMYQTLLFTMLHLHKADAIEYILGEDILPEITLSFLEGNFDGFSLENLKLDKLQLKKLKME